MGIVEDHGELIVRASRDRRSERGREREREKEEGDAGDEAWYSPCSILHGLEPPQPIVRHADADHRDHS